MKNIGSIKYRDDLNKLICIGRRGRAFVLRHGQEGLVRGVELILEGVVPKDDGDVHLEGFYASNAGINFFFQNAAPTNLIIYPSKSEIERFLLKKGKFYTNIHQDADPLHIRDVQGIYLHPTDRRSFFWLAGGEDQVPNEIDSVFLFKRNPFTCPQSYDGFAEFIEYDPDNK